MSLFKSNPKSAARGDDRWRQAEGVLAVDRALADEHEALHSESLSAHLDGMSLEFDASQFTDIPAIVRALRKALGTSGVSMPDSPAPKIRIDTELTPRDMIGRFLLQTEELKSALAAYEALAEPQRANGATVFADALARTFNTLLDSRLVDEPVFRAMLDAGAVAALGEGTSRTDASETQPVFIRRANRALLETAYPEEIEQMRDRRLTVIFSEVRKKDTAALCLSGGGIRSSTFALGIMQGLARHGLLGKFDYLSTVSGGGLSGGWLSAWMRREGASAVHSALRAPGREKIEPEPEPLQGLRSFSHWLTPNASALSVDSWTVIATVVRNLLLNWFVLLPLLAGIIALPRLLQGVLALDVGTPGKYAGEQLALAIAIGLMFMLASAGYVEWVRASGDDFAAGRRGSPSQNQVIVFFLIPRLIGAVILVLALHIADALDQRNHSDVIQTSMGMVVFLVWAVSIVVVPLLAVLRRGRQTRWRAFVRSVKVVISGTVGYVLPLALLNGWKPEIYVTFAPAVLLLGSVLGSMLYTGLTSDNSSDAEREWTARANAWVMLVAIAWMVASGLVLLGPHLLTGLWQKLTLLGVGGVSSWFTVILSKQAAPSTAQPTIASKLTGMALSLAGPVVVASLVMGLALANDASINMMCLSDVLSSAFNCTPPNADSTSAPLLAILAGEDRMGAQEAAGDLMKSFEADSVFIPSTKAASESMARADSAVLANSDSLTVFALGYDTLEMRRIRRAASDTTGPRNDVDSSVTVLQSFRRFTLRRNTALRDAYERDTLAEDVPALDKLWPGVEQALKVDSLIKLGIVARDSGAARVASLVDSVKSARSNHRPAEHALWRGVLLFMLVLLVAGLFFSTIVNTNSFSLHALWRARTVRAFLGTTRPDAARNPNPFTGFDGDDDVPMRDLWPARVSSAETAAAGERSEAVPPMHVLNVTLNLAAGRNLAWQQRKGESMTLTPLHAGSAFTGYRRMEGHPKPATHTEQPKPGYGGPEGVSLGTAMAISGAAASPNDGAGTTAVGAFLMTFFNARLGWWLGNPGAPGADTWKRSAPQQRLTPIFSEMFGNTSDRSKYVYLSDGGHFENLALYEMVLRRNRFIVVSDGGADPDYSFEDLGNAVRKIRIDFGIPIDFESPVNIKRGDSSAGAYWATARIRYSAIDMAAGGNPDDYDGVLLYIKPAVYGAIEPRDVVNYWKLSPTFPQETSADQFFSESQFESYRALGAWIIDHLVSETNAGGAPVTVTAHRKGSLLSIWPGLRGKQL